MHTTSTLTSGNTAPTGTTHPLINLLCPFLLCALHSNLCANLQNGDVPRESSWTDESRSFRRLTLGLPGQPNLRRFQVAAKRGKWPFHSITLNAGIALLKTKCSFLKTFRWVTSTYRPWSATPLSMTSVEKAPTAWWPSNVGSGRSWKKWPRWKNRTWSSSGQVEK